MITTTSNKIHKQTIIKKPNLSTKTSTTIKLESRNCNTKASINAQKTYNFKKSIQKETDDKNKFQLKRIKVNIS
jgi:hypothetical protein